MQDQNCYTATGRLGRDAEVRYSQAGKAWVSLNVAVGNGKKSDGTDLPTTWIDVKCFGGMAERFSNAKKGQRIFVIGRVEQESWEDKSTGQRRSKHVVKADICMPVEEEEPRGDPKPRAAKKAAPEQSEPVDYGEIPF